jgi:hypothetical protein
VANPAGWLGSGPGCRWDAGAPQRRSPRRLCGCSRRRART